MSVQSTHYLRRTIAAGLCLALCFGAINAAPSIGLSASAVQEPPGIIVIYADDHMSLQDFQALAEDGIPSASVEVLNTRLATVELPPDARPKEVMEAVRDNPAVLEVARDRYVQTLSSMPNDPRYLAQRHYLGPTNLFQHAIGMERVWSATRNPELPFSLNRFREGATMAVVDTGVSPCLLEDAGRYVAVHNYITGTSDTTDDSRNSHGTAVASVISANTNNGFNVAGVLHDLDSRILVYKALNAQDQGKASDLMAAMMAASDRGARIINASFGHPATIQDSRMATAPPDLEIREMWQHAIDYCTARGTLVIAASGNYTAPDSHAVFYPAAANGVLAVGSINPMIGTRSGFSSFGPEVDVVAPGEAVWVSLPSGGNRTALGTSFATPLVSGAVAYLWSLVPGLSATQMYSLITSNAVATYGPNPGQDPETGYGRFDAYRIYTAMRETIDVQDPVTMAVAPVSGRQVRLTWSAAEGRGVFYRFGYEGGSTYQTTSREGRLVLPSDGTHTVWVRSYASDRWGAAAPTTATVTVTSGSPAVSAARYEGRDRFRTALAISRASHPTTASAIVIASGENWPDGLSGGVLAAVADGPLLLTRSNRLSLEVRDEILRLNPSAVYILGGSGAVSPAVADAVRSLPGTRTVTRLHGVDRYETAARVAARVAAYNSGQPQLQVILASGETHPDALSGSALAAATLSPILLTRRASLPAATASILSTLSPTRTLVLGGTGAISRDVELRLTGSFRLAGTDRYHTSRIIAAHGLAGAQPAFRQDALGFSTGRAFPDALAAGPFMGARRTPILLADGLTVPLSAWLTGRPPTPMNVSFFGGPGAFSYSLELDVRQTLSKR